jgi:hypothetical protein
MPESDKPHAVESWEIMLLSRDRVGATELQKIFSRGQTQINRYCMSPLCGDAQRNPLDRLRLMFEKLVGEGEDELVRASLNILAECIDSRVRPVRKPVPDKDTVEEECLDDYPELTELDRLIGRREHPRVVQRQAERVKQEVDETMVSYMELWNKKYGLIR